MKAQAAIRMTSGDRYASVDPGVRRVMMPTPIGDRGPSSKATTDRRDGAPAHHRRKQENLRGSFDEYV